MQVTLRNPDGTVFDLTSSTIRKLHIMLDSGTTLTRDMAIVGAPTAGVVQYAWLTSDWNAGGLVTGSHQMEYEIVSGAARLTFPNDGHDFLRITGDIGQG